MNIDVFFKSDLETSKTVKVSMYPNIPRIDEEIFHELLGHQLIETKQGYILLLNLRNPDTKEEYTYGFSDIQEIEPNRNFSPEASKYYLHCTNRAIKNKLIDIRESMENGLDITDEEKELLNSNEEVDTYRISFRK
ncbi:hypothetical protein CHH83_05835 [Bacillus sp. 7586-K]|nr:hypothetical protein CHH83_05835 [Bacillus sp. 7586-K]